MPAQIPPSPLLLSQAASSRTNRRRSRSSTMRRVWWALPTQVRVRLCWRWWIWGLGRGHSSTIILVGKMRLHVSGCLLALLPPLLLPQASIPTLHSSTSRLRRRRSAMGSMWWWARWWRAWTCCSRLVRCTELGRRLLPLGATACQVARLLFQVHHRTAAAPSDTMRCTSCLLQRTWRPARTARRGPMWWLQPAASSCDVTSAAIYSSGSWVRDSRGRVPRQIIRGRDSYSGWL